MIRVLMAALAVLLGLSGCSGTTTVTESPAASATATTSPSVKPTTSPSARPSASPTRATPTATTNDLTGVSGLPVIALADLPPEAQETYEIIWDGGPYRYRQDDQIFGNREGNLPKAEYGWYREYTVETPGSPDRGARRFVVSEDNVFFYTDDHYDSFSEVIE